MLLCYQLIMFKFLFDMFHIWGIQQSETLSASGKYVNSAGITSEKTCEVLATLCGAF